MRSGLNGKAQALYNTRFAHSALRGGGEGKGGDLNSDVGADLAAALFGSL